MVSRDDNVERNPMRSRIKDIELVREYQRYRESDSELKRKIAEFCLKMLYRRYDELLKLLAWNVLGFVSKYEQIDDLIGEARVGAELAFRRYDESKGVKVITHLQDSVAWFLRGRINETGFIRLPKQQQSWRSYFAGKYDDEKKKEFEREHSPEEIEEMKARYGATLNPIFTSWDVEFQEDDGTFEERIGKPMDTDAIHRKIRYESWLLVLKPRERNVAKLAYEEGMGEEQIAETLGITCGQARGALHTLKYKVKAEIERQVRICEEDYADVSIPRAPIARAPIDDEAFEEGGDEKVGFTVKEALME